MNLNDFIKSLLIYGRVFISKFHDTLPIYFIYSYEKDFLDNPALFTEGTTRFDIGQGSAGTCWFLSTVANIADNERILGQVGLLLCFQSSAETITPI